MVRNVCADAMLIAVLCAANDCKRSEKMRLRTTQRYTRPPER